MLTVQTIYMKSVKSRNLVCSVSMFEILATSMELFICSGFQAFS